MNWPTVLASLKKEEKRFRNNYLDHVFPHLPHKEFSIFFSDALHESKDKGDEAIRVWFTKGRWPQMNQILKYFIHRRFSYAIEKVVSLSCPHYPSNEKIVSDPLVNDHEIMFEWLLINDWTRVGSGRAHLESMDLWLHLDARASMRFFYPQAVAQYTKN
jgi:hypothetical protein